MVALLAEGVDRNLNGSSKYYEYARSPSSRRAWIEILIILSVPSPISVSPSSRRAWIEMCIRSIAAARSTRRPPRGGRG